MMKYYTLLIILKLKTEVCISDADISNQKEFQSKMIKIMPPI